MSFKLTDKQRDIVEANIGLVPYLVNRYLRRFTAEYDDMISVGYYGLCKAAKNYRPSHGQRFSAYATMVICRTIYNELILPRTRVKRGTGVLTISLNEKIRNPDTGVLESVTRDIVDPANVESEVINKISWQPVWECLPTYLELQRLGLSQYEYGKLIGKAHSTVSMRRRKELQQAKRVIVKQGLLDDYLSASEVSR